MSSFSSRSSVSLRGGGIGSGASLGGWGSSLGLASAGGGMSVVGQRAGSVYGGAGGRGIRISTVSSSSSAGGRIGAGGRAFGLGGGYMAGGFGAGSGGGGGMGFSAFSRGAGDEDAIAFSEKQTLQNLNDRLAKYLEKVRTLETANAKLEAQIREWGLSHTTVSTRDLGGHQTTIDDLRTKILAAAAVAVDLSLQVDNAKLAADDFRIKYENELSVRQSVEADIGGLKRMVTELALAKSDLELQLEGLKEEIVSLKKNHEEEALSFRTQLTGQVQVEVDAAPAMDLNAVIAEIREQYEALVAKNRRDAEAWFKAKAEGVEKEVHASTEVLQTSSAELKDGQANLRNLELELQSLHAMKATLEGSLADTEARYSAMLMSLQASVTSLEVQLSQLRADTERSAQEYQALLDIKTRLEMEIAEYRRLLEGSDAGLASGGSVVIESSGAGGSSHSKRVVTVVQELVDGKVVSSASTQIKS